MRKKGYLFSLILFWSISVFGQKNNYIYDNYGPIYTLMNDSIIVYNTKKGKQIEATLNQIYFKAGEDKLKEFLINNYYKSNHYDDYSYRVFFFILFDSKLKIKEIRGVVLPTNNFAESQKERIKMFIKGLKKTKSKWVKKTKQKWYVYCFSFVTD